MLAPKLVNEVVGTSDECSSSRPSPASDGPPHLALGSVRAISHGSDDVDDPERAARMRAVADTFAGTASPVTLRSRARVLELLGDFELPGPGLVDIADWPTHDPQGRRAATWAAVPPGRRPHHRQGRRTEASRGAR